MSCRKVGKAPIRLKAEFFRSSEVDRTPGCRRDRADAFEERFFGCRITLPVQEHCDERAVRLWSAATPRCENLLDLGRKQYRTIVVNRPQQRLDAEAITGNHQSIAAKVEDGNRPHS